MGGKWKVKVKVRCRHGVSYVYPPSMSLIVQKKCVDYKIDIMRPRAFHSHFHFPLLHGPVRVFGGGGSPCTRGVGVAGGGVVSAGVVAAGTGVGVASISASSLRSSPAAGDTGLPFNTSATRSCACCFFPAARIMLISRLAARMPSSSSL